ASGMAVAILIGLWIVDELSYDRYHANHSRIAVVLRNGTLTGQTYTTAYLPYALGDELKTKYGENFKHVVMAWPESDHILSVGEKSLTSNGQFIEPAAPEMFSLRMVHGSVEGLLEQNSIMLSASFAKALFGDTDPVGKDLRIDNRMDVTVTGVYENLPHNSHLHSIEFFAPWDLWVSFNQWMLTQGFTNNFLIDFVVCGSVNQRPSTINSNPSLINSPRLANSSHSIFPGNFADLCQTPPDILRSSY